MLSAISTQTKFVQCARQIYMENNSNSTKLVRRRTEQKQNQLASDFGKNDKTIGKTKHC